MPSLLEIKHLTSQLSRNGKPLLNQVSFKLNPKERVVLRGPSGVGKSLLLRSITFLDPNLSGEVWFQEQKVSSETIPSFRSQVVYLSQKPSLLEGTVEENLKYFLKLEVNKNKAFLRDKILNLLHGFNLEATFLNQPAKHLSGGESQILALLRVLLLEPKIILLDEPTASLDKSREEIFEKRMIDWVESSKDRAFIWITHRKEQETKVGNAFLTLNEGNLTEFIGQQP